MKKLRNLIRARLMTKAEVAQAIGVSYATIWAWETGKATPRATAVRKLCAVLSVTPEELLTADEYARIVGPVGDDDDATAPLAEATRQAV